MQVREEEQKLEEENLHLREMAQIVEESFNDVFFLDTTTFKFVFANKSFLKRLGYSIETLKNLTLIEVGYQISNEEFRRSIVSLLTGNKERIALDIGLDTEKASLHFHFDIRLATFSGNAALIVSTFDITQRVLEKEEIQENASNAQLLFDYSPILIWEEDFSKVKNELDKIKASGITDFKKYFDDNPEEVAKLASFVEVTQINKRSLDFYHVASKDELETNIAEWFIDDSLIIFKEELIALAKGDLNFEGEIPVKTPEGELKYLYFKLAVPPQYQHTMQKVIVTFIDITNTRRAYFSVQPEK